MIAPKTIDVMKKEIKNSSYFKFKRVHFEKSRKKYGTNNLKCDICERTTNQDDIIICACCEIFCAHYQCDNDIYISEFGYFCPNCRSIFNLNF